MTLSTLKAAAMSNSFRIVGLDHQPFAKLFEMSDAELRPLGAVRRFADESPGFPCRVSLEDARVGEELMLLPYLHQPAASPYRASGPVFVRRNAMQASLPEGVVPPYVTRRLVSVRAYDHAHLMVEATVVEGSQTRATLEAFFGSGKVAYIQLHNARQGCFSCQANRA